MSIQQVIHPSVKNLGEFTVRRVLPALKQQQMNIGPWVFFDEMGPVTFEANNGINVRPHPHIHLGTVTYLFEGEILHRDSLGSHQAILPGDVNLMIAGTGITHSERERPEIKQTMHKLHGLQLWHALPKEHENCAPQFIHYPAAQLPTVNVNNTPVRVMMGAAYGVCSPVKTFCETLYLEAKLDESAQLTTPGASNLGIYIVSGRVNIDDITYQAQQMLVLAPNSTVTLTSLAADTVIAMIGGEDLGKRYIEWNFISSEHENIAQAKRDWQQQKFPKIPDDQDEYIPLP